MQIKSLGTEKGMRNHECVKHSWSGARNAPLGEGRRRRADRERERVTDNKKMAALGDLNRATLPCKQEGSNPWSRQRPNQEPVLIEAKNYQNYGTMQTLIFS